MQNVIYRILFRFKDGLKIFEWMLYQGGKCVKGSSIVQNISSIKFIDEIVDEVCPDCVCVGENVPVEKITVRSCFR